MAGTPPWHLWGQQQVVTLTITDPVAPGITQSGQIARVEYKRPDTFQFMFGAKVLGSNIQAAEPLIQAVFDINIGLGLVNFNIPAFELFNILPVTQKDVTFFSTSVIGPRRAGTDTLDLNLVDQLVAQTINAQFRATMSNVTQGDSVQLQVFAMFAPRNHVRPDWFDGKVTDGSLGGH